ncbi:hypothetical protein [Victivallis sp.]
MPEWIITTTSSSRWRLAAGEGSAEPVPGGVSLRLPEFPRFALFQLDR